MGSVGGDSKRMTTINSKMVSTLGTEGGIIATALKQSDVMCDALPGRKYRNPLFDSSRRDDRVRFVPDNEGRRYSMVASVEDLRLRGQTVAKHPYRDIAFRTAGPRAQLHFNPRETIVGIVTCGGLCPGLNNVIRSITRAAHSQYNVKRVIGFRYGFFGLTPAGRKYVVDLTEEKTQDVHHVGGTVLGTSRGGQSFEVMVSELEHHGVNVLFTIGGEGTQKGAADIVRVIKHRGLDIAVIGIPKTIDNDVAFCHRTFGFDTAVEAACHAVASARAEARAHAYGVSVVKVMGRHSGFIAAATTSSIPNVDVCLIPELSCSIDFLMPLIISCLLRQRCCVIVVAEGFGQEWAKAEGHDKSGNKKLIDIGPIVTKGITDRLRTHAVLGGTVVKYLDPSYTIRAAPANAQDATFCTEMSVNAMHEAMAGTTNSIISLWHGAFITVPIPLAVSLRKVVDPMGQLWNTVRESTEDFRHATDEHMTRLKEMRRMRLLHQLSLLPPPPNGNGNGKDAQSKL